MTGAGMDNVRNMTGSPIAGIDPHEFLDVRGLNYGEALALFRCGVHSSELMLRNATRFGSVVQQYCISMVSRRQLTACACVSGEV